jgi:hypothetical protein
VNNQLTFGCWFSVCVCCHTGGGGGGSAFSFFEMSMSVSSGSLAQKPLSVDPAKVTFGKEKEFPMFTTQLLVVPKYELS